jgi:phospholipid/cholesterol/gamma-HCH transport system substrate-binding protein
MTFDYEKSNNLKTGFFVFFGTVITVFSIIILGGDKKLFASYNKYSINFKQVQGLNIGSVVSLSGINIGNVVQMDFSSQDDSVLVTLNVEQQFANRITNDSLASIKTQGALGDRYIFITSGNNGSRPLDAGALIKSDDEGDFFDIISKKGPQISNAANVIDEMKLLLENLNKNNNPGKLIENLVIASKQIENLSKEGQLLFQDARGANNKELKQAISHLNSILKKIDNGEGTLGALINDSTIHERLTSILGKSPRNSYLKPLIRATIKSKDK